MKSITRSTIAIIGPICLTVGVLVSSLAFVQAQPTCLSSPIGLISWGKAAGTTLNDQGVSQGTLFHGAVYSSGKVVSIFSFNGVNQYFSLPQSPALPVRNTNSFTIEAWVNHQGNADNEMFNVFAYRNGGQDIQFFITRTVIGDTRDEEQYSI